MRHFRHSAGRVLFDTAEISPEQGRALLILYDEARRVGGIEGVHAAQLGGDLIRARIAANQARRSRPCGRKPS